MFGLIYTGTTTPTEAGTVGVILTFLMALYQNISWRQCQEACLDTLKTSGTLFGIISGVLIIFRFLGFTPIPEQISQLLTSLEVPRVIVLLITLSIYFVLGMFMDAVGMMLLTLPAVLPTIAKLHYDPIWFGIILVKMIEMCLVTPPLGLNCYVVSNIGKIPIRDVFIWISPFVMTDLLTIGILIMFPDIVLWLPNRM